MSEFRSDVPPSTLGVELQEGGVAVEYLDGRVAFYHGVPKKVTGSMKTAPGKETHVLVTDPSGAEGVMVYVNDRKTHDDVLESSGVGRVILDVGETEEVFPGVEVTRRPNLRNEVAVDVGIAGGRVFVFEEDDWGEESYEFVTADRMDEREAEESVEG